MQPQFNLWKATVNDQDGENEYYDAIFIRGAKSRADAEKEARYQAQNYLCENCTPLPEYGDNYWREIDGHRVIELERVEQIDSMEALLKGLNVVDFKAEH